MAEFDKIPGLFRLRTRTKGDARVCVAVLDGPVDLAHPCFEGADLTVLPVLGDRGMVVGGAMSAHGTHVASLIFGHKDSEVKGIAPQCRGLIVPIFSDRSLRVSQLDLTRGIEAAVEAGAHVINISGDQLTDGDSGDADEFLRRAVELCRDRDILIVAAAGNDRCPCHHMPAAIPSVLAVGAMDDDGRPLEFSNWGADYGHQGLLAPGGEVKGAVPGGGTTELSGTSFAAPIVTGVAALLLSLQIEEGRDPLPARSPRGTPGLRPALQGWRRPGSGAMPRRSAGRDRDLASSLLVHQEKGNHVERVRDRDRSRDSLVRLRAHRNRRVARGAGA